MSPSPLSYEIGIRGHLGCKTQWFWLIFTKNGLWSPWVSGCPLGLSWVSPGCVLGASWVPLVAPGCFLGAPGYILGASWLLLGASWLLLGASWVLLGILSCLENSVWGLTLGSYLLLLADNHNIV